MEKEQLRQLNYLRRESEMKQRQLSELKKQAAALYRQAGMEKREELEQEVKKLESLIGKHIARTLRETRRLERLIDRVPDSEMRSILTLRYEEGMTWGQVARRMGGYYTADYARKKHDRFLESYCPAPLGRPPKAKCRK